MRYWRLLILASLTLALLFKVESMVYAASRCHIKKDGTNQVLIPDLPETFWQPTGSLRKVRDGLALTLDRKVEFLGADSKVLSEHSGRCRLVYDIWAEIFSITDSIFTPFGEFKYPNAKGREALEKCASIPLSSAPKNYVLIHVVTLVNPVDAHQEERTRNWLATKGIGGSGSGVIGRALGAVINLKTESVVDYDCTP